MRTTHDDAPGGPGPARSAAFAPPPGGPGTAEASLHPDCPDWQRLGPTAGDAAVRALAAASDADADTRHEQWSTGFTRRRLLAGGLKVGVAALAAQVVTTRVSYAATPSANTGTLVVVFLRGGMDGLSVLVPGSDRYLRSARPGIAVPARTLIPVGRGFGLHPAMAPLRPLVKAGRFAAVPAVATPDLSRSHFQAQDCLERGGSAVPSVQTGWLDRVLAEAGAGSTFQAVGQGYRLPRSLAGPHSAVAVSALDRAGLWVGDDLREPTRAALAKLFTGLDHPMAPTARTALQVMRTAGRLADAEKPAEKRGYAKDEFARGLATLATLIKANVGVRVATIDVGGWDMHTDIGTVDRGDMTRLLGSVSAALAAFFAELGPAGDRTTAVVMSEFGRRVRQNANAGADHGHGGVALLVGGGVRGGVHGGWRGLAPSVLVDGDVPGTNDYRDLLAEVVARRVGLSPAAIGRVFPGHRAVRLGVMR